MKKRNNMSPWEQFEEDMKIVIERFESFEEDFYNSDFKNKTYNNTKISMSEVPMFIYHKLFTANAYDVNTLEKYVEDQAKIYTNINWDGKRYNLLMRKGEIFENLGAKLLNTPEMIKVQQEMFKKGFSDVKDLHKRGDVLFSDKYSLDFKYTEQSAYEKLIVKASEKTIFKNVADIEQTIINSLHFEGAGHKATWKPTKGELIFPEEYGDVKHKLTTINPKTVIFIYPSGAEWTSVILADLVKRISNEMKRNQWKPVDTRLGQSDRDMIDPDGINRHTYIGLFYGHKN
jgi:hypothetical protein